MRTPAVTGRGPWHQSDVGVAAEPIASWNDIWSSFPPAMRRIQGRKTRVEAFPIQPIWQTAFFD